MDIKRMMQKKKIVYMNSNNFEASDMYSLRVYTPIGFKGDEITNDFCVLTMIGSKDILTMFTVL